jgi:hypothetical protein
MRGRLTSNIDKIVGNWVKRAGQLAPRMSAATKQATRTVYSESRKELRELVYDKPVPSKEEYAEERGETITIKGETYPAGYITKNGKKIKIAIKGEYASKKAWRRTGNLRRSERMRIESPFEGIIYNDANYAKARHDVGDPSVSKRKSNRRAPWRNNAIKNTKSKVRKIYRDAMNDAIRAGIIPGMGGLK